MRTIWLKILSIPFAPETQSLAVKRRRGPEVIWWDGPALVQWAMFETVHIHAEKWQKVPSGQRTWRKQTAVLGNVEELNKLRSNWHLNLKSYARSLAGTHSLPLLSWVGAVFSWVIPSRYTFASDTWAKLHPFLNLSRHFAFYQVYTPSLSSSDCELSEDIYI